MKLVSVIIPVYNVEQYIAQTVQSVLEQTYSCFEMLIVDDGSPDRSGEICRQFSDPRIKVIRQPNRGLAGARNTGIRHAQGEYLAFLDGDDLWHPENLAQKMEHLENSSQVGVSFSPSALIDEFGQPLGSSLKPKLKEITPKDLLCDNPVGNGSAAVFRRDVFDAIKFQDSLYGTVEWFYYDEHFRQAEDIECLLRIVLQTDWQLEGIAEALTFYRINSGGLSASLLKQLESLEKVIEKTRVYAPEFIGEWENSARAYLLRYLARSALRFKLGSMAVELINRAIAVHWQILVEQPRRTIMTSAAAYLLWLLPRLYTQTEAIARKMTAAYPKRRILQ